MLRQEPSLLCVSLSELQAYCRVDNGEEEAVLASLLRVATEMCETFLNQTLIARQFELEMRTGRGWTLLSIQPVRAITGVRRIGESENLSAYDYRIDVDHDGRGFLSGLPSGETYVVAGTAGMAAEPNGIPDPIRQGILRLAAYLFANRDDPIGDLPKAVPALWRPYRRAGLCR
jgi:uncharacterized phiE125 gp8 family phage protein